MPEAEDVISYTLGDHYHMMDVVDAMERCRCPWCGAQPKIKSYFFNGRFSGWMYDCSTTIIYNDYLNDDRCCIQVTITRSPECKFINDDSNVDVI